MTVPYDVLDPSSLLMSPHSSLRKLTLRNQRQLYWSRGQLQVNPVKIARHQLCRICWHVGGHADYKPEAGCASIRTTGSGAIPSTIAGASTKVAAIGAAACGSGSDSDCPKTE